MGNLDRLARLARRGLRASAVTVQGTSRETILTVGTIVESARNAVLYSVQARIEQEAGDSIIDHPAIGIALRHPNGAFFGSLCAVDDETRVWSDDDRAFLTDIAALFQSEAELAAEIERRRLAEEAGDLVTRELSHRIKNIFTVIASLVALSARGYPEAAAFARTLGERIAALGRANDYVRPHSAGSSRPTAQSFLGLVNALMVPYQQPDRAHVLLEGDDAPVGPISVTTLALVLHELATNAVKYGALSRPAGQITISSRKDNNTLTLTWREEGGPEIEAPPSQTGFGTILSQRAATAQLGATIHHDWRRDGLILRMEIPLRRLAL